ncbi:hypothetical protein BH708_00455 [Brachybacterium sp. P6-10-X1]|uniref:AAA family ATPase n=1 Tax=Brachybacterium sp. P6-10-X1 TaxID=1903186 RepID=UPI000971A66A|nr:ATP-binding protein [Brachybacterium sp. P6-10-X1]APX31451.1 hypothetical protein BH708_00455 [Brachybacterium sp. P6-10-X1]
MALTLMCGLSFAGKSTLAKHLARELPAQLISLDLLNAERGLDGGQGIPPEEWATTNRLAHERARVLLAHGHHVVLDDTGSPRFIRDAWRATAEAADAPFALIWVQITLDLQRERVRANREARGRLDVTDAVLHDHAASFEPPIDEDAIVVDARSTDDPERVRVIARALSPARVEDAE